jgi:hypothetical protein
MDKETKLFLELWEKENWDYVFSIQGISESNRRAVARIVFDVTRKHSTLAQQTTNGAIPCRWHNVSDDMCASGSESCPSSPCMIIREIL